MSWVIGVKFVQKYCRYMKNMKKILLFTASCIFTVAIMQGQVTNTSSMKFITTYNDLAQAVQQGNNEIIISANITVNHGIILPEGTSIKGIAQDNGELPMLLFPNSDGIGLTANNKVEFLKILVPENRRAIYNTYSLPDLGKFTLKDLSVKGQISVITRIGVESARVELENVDIFAADARHYLEQPQKYGVNVLQGALTIYNMNGDKSSLVNVYAKNITIGRKGLPVLGSGIFIAGGGDNGGRTNVELLETGAVYSTGAIPYGVADYITGGVFILNGAHADKVLTQGELVTYGVNDMVTDVWGSVDTWVSNAPITSYGPSGIGFVNFGTVKHYEVNAPVQTYGEGARGYNQYDGTVGDIRFQSIETFGNGSVGVQISKPIGTMTVTGDIITHGSVGNSLVKGVIVQLPAYALSIKDGGVVDKIDVKGDIRTHGDNVTTYIVDKGGIVKNLSVGGKVEALGKGSKDKEGV